MNVRAFTLVELLAVIAIIGLLAALLFPVFAQSKDQSKSTVCISNLRQIGLATTTYLGDHDDRYPVVVNALDQTFPRLGTGLGRPADRDPKEFLTVTEGLSGYVKDSRIFRCPMDFGSEIAGYKGYPTFAQHNGGVSYLFPTLMGGASATAWPSPAESIWTGDGSPEWHSPAYEATRPETFGINALFYDFHARYVKSRNAPDHLIDEN